MISENFVQELVALCEDRAAAGEALDDTVGALLTAVVWTVARAPDFHARADRCRVALDRAFETAPAAIGIPGGRA